MNKKIVHLRGYRAKAGLKSLAYDSKGNVQNENHIIKVSHGTMEWKNMMLQINSLGFVDVKVEAVFLESARKPVEKDGVTVNLPDYMAVDSFEDISKEVKDAFFGKEEAKAVTPEQKRIEELEAAVRELTSSKAKEVEAKPTRTRRTQEQIEADKNK